MFDRVESLLCDRHIKDGPALVMMHELHGLSIKINAVAPIHFILRGCPFVGVPEMFAGGYDLIVVAPVLIGCFDLKTFIAGEFQVNDRLFDIGPYPASKGASVAVGLNGEVAIIEMQLLSEILRIKDGRDGADAQPAGLEHGILFVEAATAGNIDQQVALLDPDIHADVSTATGHGRLRAGGRGRPHKVLLRPCTHRDQQRKYEAKDAHLNIRLGAGSPASKIRGLRRDRPAGAVFPSAGRVRWSR